MRRLGTKRVIRLECKVQSLGRIAPAANAANQHSRSLRHCHSPNGIASVWSEFWHSSLPLGPFLLSLLLSRPFPSLIALLSFPPQAHLSPRHLHIYSRTQASRSFSSNFPFPRQDSIKLDKLPYNHVRYQGRFGFGRRGSPHLRRQGQEGHRRWRSR